ncbi:MAG: dihydropteroate synthase [Proteobacteria bacterium]|nr:dihydropteroate synthase [Pseudomonadota bacterium]
MGVINVTPDSFYDGGKFNSTNKALIQAIKLISQGADIIDVGGESTRPGAEETTMQTEISRVVPVIAELRKQNPYITISIDTSKAQVMQAAIIAGANFINDVNALQNDGCVELVAQANLPVCLMHKQGQPKTMQQQPKYTNVLDEVMAFLQHRVSVCLAAGIKQENIILDPGIGFGKALEHNLTLLRNIKQLKSLGYPVLLGVSRKALIGEILNQQVADRLYGSLAVAQFAVTQGAEILRVHDVKATADILQVASTLLNANW